MIYALIYLWVGVVMAGFFHMGVTTNKFPTKPTTLDYFLVTFLWPIPALIALYTIISDIIKITKR